MCILKDFCFLIFAFRLLPVETFPQEFVELLVFRGEVSFKFFFGLGSHFGVFESVLGFESWKRIRHQAKVSRDLVVNLGSLLVEFLALDNEKLFLGEVLVPFLELQGVVASGEIGIVSSLVSFVEFVFSELFDVRGDPFLFLFYGFLEGEGLPVETPDVVVVGVGSFDGIP